MSVRLHVRADRPEMRCVRPGEGGGRGPRRVACRRAPVLVRGSSPSRALLTVGMSAVRPTRRKMTDFRSNSARCARSRSARWYHRPVGGKQTPLRMADRFAAARAKGFVGRQAEVEAFRRILTDGRGAVVHVHGSAGIGKSTLLHQFAWLATRSGRPVTVIAQEPAEAADGAAGSGPAPPHVAPAPSSWSMSPERCRPPKGFLPTCPTTACWPSPTVNRRRSPGGPIPPGSASSTPCRSPRWIPWTAPSS
ncbi:ATP-binding protein [Streptomyces sp. NPDC048550]|uniref:ATP-binding protein n=1 Tax=Streptomyces sp. NPDC048550 TaxID=3155739 RepID=UPI0034396D5A